MIPATVLFCIAHLQCIQVDPYSILTPDACILHESVNQGHGITQAWSQMSL